MKTAPFVKLLSLQAHAPDSASSRQAEEPRVLDPHNFPGLNSTRTRTRYGPFTVPGINDPETMGMQSFLGILDFPCADCIVTGIAGDLEYEDGSVANADTGMWLHHTLLASLGRQDETCDEDLGLARIWASGNERTPVDLTNNGTRKAGLDIGQEIIGHTTELMNESPDARDAYLVLEVEYLPSPTPEFRGATPLYLDVAGYCTDSEVAVPEGEEVFNRSIEWTVGYPGEILTVFGHLHDGGTRQELGLNGKVVCEYVARYGESEEFITPGGLFDEVPADGMEGEHNDHEGDQEEEGGHDHASPDRIEHISSITYCEDLGRFAAGDVFSVNAYYDMGAHTPMQGHHGGWEPVMGISMAYVLKDEADEAPDGDLSSSAAP